MATLAERIRARAELARLAAASPSVPTTPPISYPVMPDVPRGADLSFMNKVDSILARFRNARQAMKALHFFERFCMEVHTNVGLSRDFDNERPWPVGFRQRWLRTIVGIPEAIRTLINKELEKGAPDPYLAIRNGMELFKERVIDPVRPIIPDRNSDGFFLRFLEEYERSPVASTFLIGIGGKRRKTWKSKKSKKRRQTKLRIKKRLMTS